jgi:hypothetical protein
MLLTIALQDREDKEDWYWQQYRLDSNKPCAGIEYTHIIALSWKISYCNHVVKNFAVYLLPGPAYPC